MNSLSKTLRNIAASVALASTSLAAPQVLADSAPTAPADAATQQQAMPNTPPQQRLGLRLQTENEKPGLGSGPDKTKFNIVSKQEAERQQRAAGIYTPGSGSGDSRTSDGSGGNGSSGSK